MGRAPNIHRRALLGAVAAATIAATIGARADVVRVAVAANFAAPMQALAQRFEAQSGHTVLISAGSTGAHYAQIENGAPFDVFFAADERRPALLEQQGRAVAGSRFTYAIGQIVLWSPEPDLVDARGRVLGRMAFRHLAIANPQLAPYGVAARAVLERLGLWEALRDRLVLGQDIGQAYGFVHSGNAELGFVAYSQVLRPGKPVSGSLWLVPQSMYPPIEQQAVLLKEGAAAREFLEFAQSAPARALIRGYGYRYLE